MENNRHVFQEYLTPTCIIYCVYILTWYTIYPSYVYTHQSHTPTHTTHTYTHTHTLHSQVCHSGACGECPLSLPRTCPCTKTSKCHSPPYNLTAYPHPIPSPHTLTLCTEHDLPCIMDTPTCDDSCDALLTCGRHHCTRRCHHGDCGQCIQVCERLCRCGKRRKCLPCAREEWLCESKCQRLRNCQNHSCRRKVV